MSRFFRGDSDSESDDSSSNDSGNEAPKPIVPTRFSRTTGDSSDDSDTETKRVVRSVKDKRLEELEVTSTSIKGRIKANEWGFLQQDFDKLNKALQKATSIVNEVPRIYIKTIVMLEDALNKAAENKEAVKKLPPAHSKALTVMRQKVKKNNATHERQISEYRKNPDKDASDAESDEEDEEEEDSEESSEDEKPVQPKAKPAATAAPAKPKSGFFALATEGDSDEEDEDESDSSDTDNERYDNNNRANKWVLKPKDAAKEATKPKKDKPVRPAPTKKAQTEEVAPSKEGPSKELTPEQVDKKLQELLELRGRKGTGRLGQVEQLEALTNYAKTDDKLAVILVHLVDAQFDVSHSVASHMPANVWKSALTNINRILALLEKNPSLTLAATEEGGAEGERVSANLLGFIERLDDEYTKSLQNIDDPHTHEYVQRLQDEQAFIDLAERVQKYYERTSDLKNAARVAARRLEHLYFKSEKDVHALAKAAAAKETKSDEQEAAVPESTATPFKELIPQVVTLVYTHGDERLRARTMLMHIYHHALHDRFYEARDMLLMSHLQENIHLMDIPTQILFNRTMVQLGLCAFRSNLIVEAHSCLADICGGGRVKELLAQGVTNTQRFGEKNTEQEKLERKRLVPFHMHLSLDLLECVHLISAMLLEVPNMASNPFDPKKKLISRTFRRLLDYFDRQVFTGPPENNRDFVAAASKALASGDWKTCANLLLSLKVWALMPNADHVKDNLKRRIQEEGLRTYLFSFGQFYDSMSLSELSSMFELPNNTVHSLVSKMIINEELYASWDQPTGSIIMQRAEPTKLQYLALQFAEKAAVFLENNERMFDARTGGGYGYGKGDAKQGGQAKERGQWQDGRQQYQQYNRGPRQQRHQDNRNFAQQGGKQRYDRERGEGHSGRKQYNRTTVEV